MIMKNPEITICNKFLKYIKLKNEWFEEPENPEKFLNEINQKGIKADIFTFRQRLPETKPKFDYYYEMDPLAVIPITTYENWFTKQVKTNVRTAIRKSFKKGLEVRVEELNDTLINSIVDLVNETPIRQGRPYQYFGYSFEQIKNTFSPGPYYCEYLGAYYENELIGLIKLLFAGKCSHNFVMISKLEHRDKSPQNALIAKAVERTALRETPYLLYGEWAGGGLGRFKQNVGCKPIKVPKYYIPLTIKGEIAIKFNLHRGIKNLLPERIRNPLRNLRKKMHSMKYGY